MVGSIATNPAAGAAYAEGVRLLKLAELAAAEARFREASNLDHRSPDILAAVGVTAELQGHMGEAERAFRAALEIDPSHKPARNGIAQVALERLQYDLAVQLYTENLEANPKACGHATYGLAMTYKWMGDQSKAKEYFRRYMSCDTTPANYRYAESQVRGDTQ